MWFKMDFHISISMSGSLLHSPAQSHTCFTMLRTHGFNSSVPFFLVHSYTFVCKKHYVSILSEELGLDSLPGNPTYNITDLSASEVLDNHKSVLTSFGIETSDDELDLPYIYWIPKMHKTPYIHRFIAG